MKKKSFENNNRQMEFFVWKILIAKWKNFCLKILIAKCKILFENINRQMQKFLFENNNRQMEKNPLKILITKWKKFCLKIIIAKWKFFCLKILIAKCKKNSKKIMMKGISLSFISFMITKTLVSINYRWGLPNANKMCVFHVYWCPMSFHIRTMCLFPVALWEHKSVYRCSDKYRICVSPEQ